MIAYLAYYESPTVVRAVRSLGHVYNDAPQPVGYAMAPFDENDPHQAPQAPAGELHADGGRDSPRPHTPAARPTGA